MKLVRSTMAAAVLSTGLFVGACSSNQKCASAAQVVVAFSERGGGGSSGSSGSHSSGGSSGARGSGSSSGFSGSKSGSGSSSGFSGSKSGSVSGTRTNTVNGHSYTVPQRVGTTYSSGGHTYTYHGESYWLGRGAPDPNNPYDSRNYSNPFSPFYHYALAVSGC